MSELLAKWLNREVGLDAPVHDFEADFASGFLFGELLSKLGVVGTSAEGAGFSRTASADGVTANFTRLGETLRRLGVKFSGAAAREVMDRQPGAALRVLYQIKMAAAKARLPAAAKGQRRRSGNAAAAEGANLTGTFRGTHAFDRVEQRLLRERIQQAVHLSRKERDVSHHLQGFEDFKREQDALARAKAAEEARAREEGVRARRQELIEKRRANRKYKDEWDAEGQAEWQRNQAARHAARMHDVRSEERLGEDRRTRRDRRLRERRTEVESGIDEFERNLERVAVDQAGGAAVEGADAGAADDGVPLPTYLRTLERKVPPASEQTRQAEEELARIREKVRADNGARHERDHRRRAIMAEQHAEAHAADEECRLGELLGRAQRVSAAEKRLAREAWLAAQYRRVVDESAAHRQRLAREERARAWRATLERDEERREAQHRAVLDRVESQAQQRRLAEEERAAAERAAAEAHCRRLAGRIAELAVKTSTYRTLSDGGLVPNRTWAEWMSLLASGAPILPGQAEPDDDKGGGDDTSAARDIDRWAAEQARLLRDPDESSGAVVDDDTLTRYLRREGVWSLPEAGGEEAATPDEAGLTGPVLQKLANVAAGIFTRPAYPAVPERPLGVLVLGKPFAGKRTVAATLADRHGLSRVSLDDLVARAVASEAAAGARLKKLLAKGKPVPDADAVALVAGEVRALCDERAEDPAWGGWVLTDFPATAAQAAALEKALSGFEAPPAVERGGPPAVVAEEGKHARVTLSRVAPAAGEAPEAMPRPWPSAVGVVLHLGAFGRAPAEEDDILSRRALGRRVDPETGALYHLEGNPATAHDTMAPPPPADEAVKARLRPLPDAADTEASLPGHFRRHDEELPALSAWFAQFGTWSELDAAATGAAVADAATDEVLAAMARQKEARELKERAAAEQAAAEEAAARQAGREAAELAATVEKELEAGEGEEAEAEPSTEASPADPPAAADPRDTSNFAAFRDVEAAKVLSAGWGAAERRYVNGLRAVFRGLRAERCATVEHVAALRKNFLRFLRRADDKNELVERFTAGYNALSHDQRGDAGTMAEWHLRADELSDALWDVTDRRRQEAEEHLAGIRADGWRALHGGLVAAQYVAAAQLEVDRYAAAVQVCHDFFATLNDGPEPVPVEHLFGSVLDAVAGDGTVADAFTLPADFAALAAGPAEQEREQEQQTKKGKGGKKGVEAEEAAAEPAPATTAAEAGLARVEAALERAAMLVVAPDAAVEALERPPAWVDPAAEAEAAEAAAAAAAAASSKKGKKKKASAGDEAGAGVREVAVDARIAAQVRAAFAAEAALLRARLAQIRRAAAEDLEAIDTQLSAEEDKMDQWIGLRIKGESDAIDTLVHLGKEAVERQEPLYHPLRLDGENAFVDRDVQLAERTVTPAVAAFEAVEQGASASGFTPAQVRAVARQFADAAPAGTMPVADAALAWARVSGAAFTAAAGGVASLPRAWSSLGTDELAAAVSAFADAGNVSWRRMLVALLLPASAEAEANDGVEEEQEPVDAAAFADALRPAYFDAASLDNKARAQHADALFAVFATSGLASPSEAMVTVAEATAALPAFLAALPW